MTTLWKRITSGVVRGFGVVATGACLVKGVEFSTGLAFSQNQKMNGGSASAVESDLLSRVHFLALTFFFHAP